MGMGIIRYILLAVSIIGGGLMAGAGVSPQEAASNLASWAKLFGVDNPPPIIQAQSTDVVVFYIGLLLVGLSIGFLLGMFLWKLWQKNKYIPLEKATRIAYEETYQSLAERFAEQMGTTPLEWYASALVTNNDFPFFGIKPYQTIVREIPSEEKTRCHISVRDGTSYLKRYGEDDPMYTNLHMKTRDFKKQLREIKSWG